MQSQNSRSDPPPGIRACEASPETLSEDAACMDNPEGVPAARRHEAVSETPEETNQQNIPDRSADLAEDKVLVRLIREAFGGSEEAARQLLDHYGTFLQQAIRGTLSPDMRQAFDSLDFAQEVWASFFADERKADKCSSPGELRAYLRAMAKYKVVDAARKEKAQKNDHRRNRPLQDAIPNLPLGTQPTPSQIVMGREVWEQLLSQQPALYQRVLLLLKEGKDTNEIATELDLSARTIRRIIARLRKKATFLTGHHDPAVACEGIPVRPARQTEDFRDDLSELRPDAAHGEMDQ